MQNSKIQNNESDYWSLLNTSKSNKCGPNILVLDDDHIYGSMLKKIAKKNNINLTFICPNMDIETLPVDNYYDVIVIDYDMGELNGCQVANIFTNTPVVLASNKLNIQKVQKNWPSSIVEFVDKRQGLKTILTEALKACKPKKVV